MDNRNGRPGDGYRPVRNTAPPPPSRQMPASSARPGAGYSRSAGQSQAPQQRRAAPPPSAPREPQRKPPRRQGSDSRWFRAILMVMITLGFCGFLAIFILQSASDLFGLNQPDEEIEVEIPENASLSQIASILSKAGVVDQQLTFRLYGSLKKDEKYYGGTYVFNTNMGYDEILRDLRTENRVKETVTITFVEGENVYEYAKKLEENRVCGAEAFLEYLETADLGYEFMDQLPENALRFRRLEGYMFPDTYDFYVGEGVASVTRKFLNNFSSKITSQMRTRMQDLNLSLDEAITLASIIQKEAGFEDEMRRVSSVFHNRLNFPEVYPKLQSDVTKHYVNKFIIPFHNTRNQAMYDAYNTYERDGLPIGPICNPGITAINAALNPAETPYYFFVTDVQEQYYYAETAQKHYENVYVASRVEGEGDMHGIDTE